MLAEYRQALHQIPEIDQKLPETAAYLRSVLRTFPCKLIAPWGDAVCAYFDFGKTQTVAFCCDMDALPVTERTGLPFASRHDGCMHACGHDGHMAIALGLAQYLSAHPKASSCNVLLIFQPAEETSGGARALCETGIFERFHVTRVYGLHLWPDLPKGAVASMAGAMMARSFELSVVVKGKSVHLARYDHGNDALDAAMQLVQALYALVQDQPCLLRFGKMVSGRVANAVSDESILKGSMRGFDDTLLDSLWMQAQEIAAKIAAQTGCELSLTRNAGYPPVTNDELLLAQARAHFQIEQTQPTYITDDFSEYQRRVPGVFFLLGTGAQPLHSPQFDFDACLLDTGLELFCTLL